MSAMSLSYCRQLFALGSMHGKHRAIAPAFGLHLAAGGVPTQQLDTDRFGAFSGEVARSGSIQTDEKPAHVPPAADPEDCCACHP